MAYQATNWAWGLNLPMSQKFTLIALADMSDENFSCYPGQKKLAGMVGVSVATVRRAIHALEAMGLITRQTQYKNDGYRSSDRYHLAVGVVPVGVTVDVEDPDEAEAVEPESQGAESQVANSHLPNCQVTSTTISPLIDDDLTAQIDRAEESFINHQESLDSPKLSIDQKFDAFWAGYPRKVSKGQAKPAFKAALKRTTFEKILEAQVEHVRKLGPKPDPAFVPYPKTWLNADHWLDEDAVVVPAAEQSLAERRPGRNVIE